MTVRLMLSNRKLNFWDKVLRWAGKARLPIMPVIDIGQEYARCGLDASICVSCEWQGFLAALCNPRVKPDVWPTKGVHKGRKPLFLFAGIFCEANRCSRQNQTGFDFGLLSTISIVINHLSAGHCISGKRQSG